MEGPFSFTPIVSDTVRSRFMVLVRERILSLIKPSDALNRALDTLDSLARALDVANANGFEMVDGQDLSRVESERKLFRNQVALLEQRIALLEAQKKAGAA